MQDRGLELGVGALGCLADSFECDYGSPHSRTVVGFLAYEGELPLST